MDNEIFDKNLSKEVVFSKTLTNVDENSWLCKNTFLTISRRNNHITITIQNKGVCTHFITNKEQFAEVIKSMRDIAR
mgnify:CR=1 FL=1